MQTFNSHTLNNNEKGDYSHIGFFSSPSRTYHYSNISVPSNWYTQKHFCRWRWIFLHQKPFARLIFIPYIQKYLLHSILLVILLLTFFLNNITLRLVLSEFYIELLSWIVYFEVEKSFFQPGCYNIWHDFVYI